MLNENNKNYKAGFIAVMGRPNVGKSTLLNALLGQTIAAVSSKPQTTRMQQYGILTLEEAQLIFIDTPGLHRPHHKLGKYMNYDAQKALEDADLGIFIVDGTTPIPHEEDHLLVDLLRELPAHPPMIMALNKVDRIPQDELEERQRVYQQLIPQAELIPISAARGDNLDKLKSTLIDLLPEAEPFFAADQVTDIYERDIASDLIRAAAMLSLKDELPHVIAVRMDEYTERGDKGGYVAATIFVERESQKPIVIGWKGKKIKRIGTMARKEIEEMSGRKIFLKLRVKVRKNWRNDENALKLFGFKK
ncbi:MAG: GTPase Era [Chloroflexota bacterium]|nr:MAG: GTPase Era [Chloroflexota bacterium]